METIYFNLVKNGLIKFVQAIHDRSVSEDSGLGAYLRNTKLSGEKKVKLNELIRKLYDLKHEGTDLELKTLLEKLLYDYEDILIATCQSHNKSEGVTEHALDNGFSIITRTYLFIARMGMENADLSKVSGELPASVLSYFCCKYKIEHLVEQVLARYGLNDSSNGHPKLSGEKERLFVEGYLSCQNTIDGLKEDLPDYTERVEKMVLERIKNLRSGLASLCSQATIGTKQSVVSFSFLGSLDVKSSYTPDEGTMKLYLDAAEMMITKHISLDAALNPKILSTEVLKAH
ncbi:hypothetical protein [Legionella sp. W05-934-2]|uniref:hypothetical protein n=1 Tax=Legionella sp. W05-934-2 TaxID=1198649 RepID=UPI0034631AB2